MSNFVLIVQNTKDNFIQQKPKKKHLKIQNFQNNKYIFI